MYLFLDSVTWNKPMSKCVALGTSAMIAIYQSRNPATAPEEYRTAFVMKTNLHTAGKCAIFGNKTKRHSDRPEIA